jgi:hypothetical protein
MVQMPCPEQRAWGGVIKRLLLIIYGSRDTILYKFRRIVIPLFILYTKWIYKRIAKQQSMEIKDYIKSGYSVVALIGIDGSPSCGVNKTLCISKAIDLLADLDIQNVTLKDANDVIYKCILDGKGLFTTVITKELRRRNLEIPFLAHDLIKELEGKESRIFFGALPTKN